MTTLPNNHPIGIPTHKLIKNIISSSLILFLLGCCTSTETVVTQVEVRVDTVKVPLPFRDTASVSYWGKDSVVVYHDTVTTKGDTIVLWKIKIVRDSVGNATVTLTPDSINYVSHDSTITTTSTKTQLSFWENFKNHWSLFVLGFAIGVICCIGLVFLVKT